MVGSGLCCKMHIPTVSYGVDVIFCDGSFFLGANFVGDFLGVDI